MINLTLYPNLHSRQSLVDRIQLPVSTMAIKVLTLQTTDLPLDRFPDYIEPLESLESFRPSSGIMASKDMASAEPPTLANKLLVKIKDEQPSRHPSPQPTHFSVPLDSNKVNGQNGHNGHRILRSATVGYIAPAFTGKDEQMKKGKLCCIVVACCCQYLTNRF